MSRPDSEKCRLCSKLSSAEAQQRHGKTGDDCWDDTRCHNRRSYYRHRGIRNHTCKQQRRNETQNDVENCDRAITVTLKILVPAIPAAVVHWYRETKDSPLHALSAELWMRASEHVLQQEESHHLSLVNCTGRVKFSGVGDCSAELNPTPVCNSYCRIELNNSIDLAQAVH